MIRLLKNKYHLYQARKASKKFGNPHEQLKLIGVTGTDGKTTTTSLIYHILQANGLKSGYISSTAAKIGKKELDTGFHVTSVDPWQLPKYLRMMVEKDVDYGVLEATSNGLDQNRFGDILFDGAVITNIREDHLDYHGTWENYARAKFRLIEKVREGGVVVLNKDDEKSAKWLKQRVKQLKQKIYVLWIEKKKVSKFKVGFTKMQFEYKGLNYEIPIFGATHNLENILQAITLCEAILPAEKVRDALASFKLPSGRLEVLVSEPFKVIVDFAHTPAALERALDAVRLVLPKGRRLITVFGCAGKRDKGRRRMGKVSAKVSDITILTAEDPRDEKLRDINTEIFDTAKYERSTMSHRFRNHDDYRLTNLGEVRARNESAWRAGEKPFIAFDEDKKASRQDAIEMALRLARRGDCIFITGKGHEKSLAFGKDEKEYQWSDQEEILRALKRLKISYS